MNFIARVRHHSLVWKNWHGSARPSGVLHGVVFRWEPSHIYRSGVLNAEQIEGFRLHPDVMLEAVGVELSEMGETPITEPADVTQEALPSIDTLTPSPPAITVKPPQPKWQPPEKFMKNGRK